MKIRYTFICELDVKPEWYDSPDKDEILRIEREAAETRVDEVIQIAYERGTVKTDVSIIEE